MRYQYRYTKDEKRQLAAANRVLDDPNSPPREINKALRHIQQIQDAAEGRAFDRAVAPALPTEPTVDELVSAIEKAEKPSLINQQVTDTPNAINAAVAPPIAAKALEVTQTAQGAVTAFCGFCDAVGPWNTRYPMDESAPKRVLLCPTCYGRMLAADMSAAQAEARARAETPPDWAGDFARKRNLYSSDFEKSRAIWAELDRENFDRQDQERIERERAEGQYHAARAEFLSRGGKL